MMNDHPSMPWRFGLPVLLIVVACTKQNPRSCVDGFCNDPQFPFCDADGTLEGQENTCIGVSCTPGDFAACRGDELISCDATGNNYNVTQCERGCDSAAGGCKGCENNDQCANPNPICDTGNSSCRGCSLDDECASRVCDFASGACLPGTSVVYAAPSGVNSGPCTLDAPCALPRAVTVASTAAVTPVLRLLPGTFLDLLKVVMPTTSPLQVVGTGATIGPTTAGVAVTIAGGANVHIRNLTLNDPSGGIVCSDPNVSSSITVEDSSLTATSGMSISRCTATFRNFEMRIPGDNGLGVDIVGPATFEAEKLNAHADSGTVFNVAGQGASVHVTNSVFENILVGASTTDTTDPGSKLLFAFDTFIMNANVQHGCQINAGSAHRTFLFENSIIKGTSNNDVIFGTGGCTLLHNILTPQSVNVPPTNSTADPQLKDIAARDFRLKSTSPAIDAAVPSTGLDPTIDFDGVARPQGAAKDLGAFEFKP